MYDTYVRTEARTGLGLEFRCLGPFSFRGSGVWRKGPARTRGGELLEYLASHARAGMSRESLCEMLWPELDADQSGARLHVAVSGARAALRGEVQGRNAILFVDGAYSWNPAIPISTDIDVFEHCVVDGSVEALVRAVSLYAGEFLAGGSAEWMIPLRIRCEQMYVGALEALAQRAFEAGDYTRATYYALELIEVDGAHERATQLAMAGFAKAGRRMLALEQCDRLERKLRKSFSVGLTSETRELRDQIARGEVGLAAM